MSNFEEREKELENRFQPDYNRLVYSSSHLIYNSIKTLKFYLDHNLENDEWEKDRNDKIRYSILDDLEQLIRYLNNSDMIDKYDLKLIVTPRFTKDDLR